MFVCCDSNESVTKINWKQKLYPSQKQKAPLDVGMSVVLEVGPSSIRTSDEIVLY